MTLISWLTMQICDKCIKWNVKNLRFVQKVVQDRIDSNSQIESHAYVWCTSFPFTRHRKETIMHEQNDLFNFKIFYLWVMSLFLRPSTHGSCPFFQDHLLIGHVPFFKIFYLWFISLFSRSSTYGSCHFSDYSDHGSHQISFLCSS